MKNAAGIWLFAILFFSACKECPDPKIDMEEADRLVVPDAVTLQQFSTVAANLLRDSAAIYTLHKKRPVSGSQVDWVSANRHYLYKIDSLKYDTLLPLLKGKAEDDYSFTKAGDVFFRLKSRVQTRCKKDALAYNHLLIYVQDKALVGNLKGSVEQVFVDSVIDAHWRYIYYMAYARH